MRTASAGRSKTRSAASAAARSPTPAVSNAPISNFESGVNSQPGAPLYWGSSSSCQLANRALHLELDQAVHLDRVLHRELLDDRLDKAVDDELAGLFLGQTVGHQVEELLVADLGDGRLVADVDVVLADADRRVRIAARVLVEQQRVADHLRLRAVRALGDLEQPAVRGPPAVLRNAFGEDVR